MPTGRGWAALGTAAALALLWVGFGEREMVAAATFLGVGTFAGVLFVRRVAPRLAVQRRVAPEQVHEGDRAIVELRIGARRPVRNLTIEDEVVGLGAARFAAARVEPGLPLSARYEVLCRPRGIYTVGPASAVVSDPLGLAESRTGLGGADRLIVYPAVEDLEGLPLVRGQDPSVQSSRPQHAQHGGEDFFTLREYQYGDDLRKVHWRSSAKRDQLMIRQLEIPWQSRALVLLDHRSEVYPTPETFEHAVRGAASVVRHLFREGFGPELWTLDTLRRDDRDRYRSAMERLATVALRRGADLHRTVLRLQKQGMAGGALVLVTGDGDDQIRSVFRLMSRDFTRTVVLSAGTGPAEGIEAFRRAGAVTVRVDPVAQWAPAWQQAMEASWSTAMRG